MASPTTARRPTRRRKPYKPDFESRPVKVDQPAAGQADDSDPESRFLLLNAAPSWLVSMIVHAVLLIILAVITLTTRTQKQTIVLSLDPGEDAPQVGDFELEAEETMDPVAFEELSATPIEVPQFELEATLDAPSVAESISFEGSDLELVDFGQQAVPKDDLLTDIASLASAAQGFEGRSLEQRQAMVARYGGTKESEEAVARALVWLVQHQLPDGSWCFDHRRGLCSARCSHPGTAIEARKGATAMALLPFLGAGHTHRHGEHQRVVFAGLKYLLGEQDSRGGFHEKQGNMYSHGLAAIVLCEAYAMTQDPLLAQPAQQALDFIAFAQDPVGGGWRYQPQRDGDTSVVGWQLMALKSGHLAGLRVMPATIRGAQRFLDSVSTDSGAYYGYRTPGQRPATTAIGLLCRMYLGWHHDEPALQSGVEYLDGRGPSAGGAGRANMYYNYYATQVMRHYEGESWTRWNEVMRDWLVETQAKEGHAAGSWSMAGGHDSDRGGRLYCTSMATMILEVYYRHMPLYGKAATTRDFPL